MSMRFDKRSTGVLSDEQLSGVLRSLPARVPPAGLTDRLRVVASHERQTQALTFGQRWSQRWERIHLEIDNMMRPLALPFAGGLFSAVALFAMCVVPTYPLRANGGFDVPITLVTEPGVKATIPIGVPSINEAIVDVTIDGEGRMIDYVVVSGAAVLADSVLRRRLENTLLFTEFVPATSFGRPVTGKVRLSVGLSRIDVKG